nr:hypothetical protein [Aeromicrobium sp.]
MSMRPAADVRPADWIEHADQPWYVVATYGPPGLTAYARIGMAGDDEYPDEEIDTRSWVDPDRARWESVIRTLAKFTATPDMIHLGLWDGGGSYRTVGPYFGNTGRRYAMMSGTLAGALDRTLLSDDGEQNVYDVPHLAWPDDRAWVIACDTDEEHNYSVGGTSEAIDAVLAIEGLQGVTVP